MTAAARRLLFLCALLLGPAVGAEEAQPGDTITWQQDLAAAFKQAEAEQKILMICVNAKRVAGEKQEPAAKGLREVVYRDPRVVGASRAFVCALLTPEGSSNDYGELRALGIDGALVSPQHIFVHPAGKTILLRKQYWPHGKDESAIEALLALMAKAEGAWKKEGAGPEIFPLPDAVDAPLKESSRGEWITRTVARVQAGDATACDAAIKSLIENDREGDCVLPLAALLAENKKNTILLVAILRGLGRDGLVLVAAPIAEQLRHKDAAVRGNAAVSLEYIGSSEKRVLAALRKLAEKEKEPSIANHAYRALGRCGAKNAKVRTLLLKKASSAKSEFASYGPCIGLAYFESDKKAARGVEKLLGKIGVPGSRRGGGQNVVKRGLVSWTLASVGDEKSGRFVREELIGGLEHVKAVWVNGLITFWDTVARVCEGEKEAMGAVEAGVRGFVSYSKSMDLARYGAETRNLMDEFRTGRESAGFRPRGDNLLNDERGN